MVRITYPCLCCLSQHDHWAAAIFQSVAPSASLGASTSLAAHVGTSAVGGSFTLGRPIILQRGGARVRPCRARGWVILEGVVSRGPHWGCWEPLWSPSVRTRGLLFEERRFRRSLLTNPGPHTRLAAHYAASTLYWLRRRMREASPRDVRHQLAPRALPPPLSRGSYSRRVAAAEAPAQARAPRPRPPPPGPRRRVVWSDR